jgi:hypothetical protein
MSSEQEPEISIPGSGCTAFPRAVTKSVRPQANWNGGSVCCATELESEA